MKHSVKQLGISAAKPLLVMREKRIYCRLKKKKSLPKQINAIVAVCNVVLCLDAN